MEAIEQTYSKAYALFKENCELRKFPKSCYKYALYRLGGKGNWIVSLVYVMTFRMRAQSEGNYKTA